MMECESIYFLKCIEMCMICLFEMYLNKYGYMRRIFIVAVCLFGWLVGCDYLYVTLYDYGLILSLI